MAIHEVTNAELLQRCAKCGAENRIALDALEVGLTRDDHVDARIVCLPACPRCRSTEFLLRSPDDEPAHAAGGSFGHLHRMLVDHVHAELVTRARVVPALKHAAQDVAAFARPLSKEAVQRWFPEGFKIDARVAEPSAEPSTG